MYGIFTYLWFEFMIHVGKYCWWKTSCTTCYVRNPMKNGLFSISGAGFLPQQYFIHGAFGKHFQLVWLHLLRSTTTDTDTTSFCEALRNLRHPHIIRVLDVTWQKQMSNEKKPRCSGYRGDNKLPSHVGIIVNHCKDPYYQAVFHVSRLWPVFFRGSRWDNL